MPIPLDERKKPASVKIHVSTGAGLDITWSDGHASHYDFTYLREFCPCALCSDERIKKLNAPVGPTENSAPSPFQLFKPRPGARGAKPVGNYALQIDFTDGHSAGIFSYDYLPDDLPLSGMRILSVSMRALNSREHLPVKPFPPVGWTELAKHWDR